MAPRKSARFLAPLGLRRTLRSSRQRVASRRQWFLFSTDQCSRPILANRANVAAPSSMLRMKWPSFLLGFAAALLLIVTGEAGDLPRSGEEAGVEIEGGDA